MSGLWLLFVLVVWGGVSWLLWQPAHAYLADGVAPRLLRIVVITLAGCLWLGVSFWYAGGRTIYYDAEVNRLCRVDGGVRVYETVKLPAEKFDKWGQINFYRPTKGESALGSEYLLKTTIHYIRQENPSLRRYHIQIFQRINGQLLGESIGYDRGGGDLPGLWHPSSYSCPKHHGETVIDKIFLNSEGEHK